MTIDYGKLTKIMKANGDSIKSLSEKLNISRPTMANYFKGAVEMPLSVLTRISMYYKIGNTKCLLEFDDEERELMAIKNVSDDDVYNLMHLLTDKQRKTFVKRKFINRDEDE